MTNLLKPEEVAERLAVSPKIVREWLRTGKIPGVRLGRLWRVDPAALERVIQEGFAQGPKPRTRRKPVGERSPRRATRRPTGGKKRAHAKPTRSRGKARRRVSG